MAYSFYATAGADIYNLQSGGIGGNNMAKEFARAFYNSKEWQTVRSYCMIRDRYKCQICGKPAEEVHHIKHLTPSNIMNNTVSLNPDNLISICRDCHFKQHEIDRLTGKRDIYKGEWEWDENGQLVPKE